MHNSDSALVLNGESDEHGDGGQVAFHEIRGSIKWVNPNDSVIGAESFPWINGYFIFTVVLAQCISDPLSSLRVLIIELLSGDKVADSVINLSWVHSGLDVCNTGSRLLSLDAKGWIDVVKAHFKGLLHAEISLCDRTVFALLLSLEVTRLLNLANNLSALL